MQPKLSSSFSLPSVRIMVCATTLSEVLNQIIERSYTVSNPKVTLKCAV